MKESSPERVPHLERFFGSPQEAGQAVEALLIEKPELSKAQVFHHLSKNKGRGKPHASRYQDDHYEGKLKGS